MYDLAVARDINPWGIWDMLGIARYAKHDIFSPPSAEKRDSWLTESDMP